MRLLTRSDFDGLVCGVLLAEAGVIDSYHFVHPKDVQDGLVQVTANDVLTNVPFIPGCGLWFDHHSSEMERLKLMKEHHFRGTSAPSPSCARLVYNYFGGRERFRKFDESGLMDAVDRSDSGQVTMEEVMNPRGWMLVSFIMDARTGLDRYSDYRITIQELMKDMIRYCRTLPVDQVLKVPDVQERVTRYFEQEKAYEEMIRSCAAALGNVLLIDLHDVKEIVSGNRFKEYVLFPGQNVSLRVLWGRGRLRMVFSCGHSIFNRTCRTDVGSLLLKYGGGGHKMVGTCQVPAERWETVRDELIGALRE
ncbi:MAG: exopolyphosphatase [Acidobacteria bacterium]|nr:exopolyphosphatase [Acidobacteriota bacterium]